MAEQNLRIVALAGGVGGARMAAGLAQVVPPENLTVIVNVGDDFEHLGLRICPDLDTVCYTLAGIANPETGWGRAQESWHALETIRQLGGPDWFNLGDRDLGVHLERTRRLRQGEALSQITADFCQAFGVQVQVLPATDEEVPTRVITDEGELSFQDYFVRRRCQPQVRGFRFSGVAQAEPAPGVISALEQADLVIFCPSNPWVSLDPLLAIGELHSLVAAKLTVGVSPIIAGRTVKGPAAKMFAELGIAPSALAAAQHYQGVLRGFVLDWADADQAEAIRKARIVPYITDILMKDQADRKRLAEEVVAFGLSLKEA